MKPKWEKKGVKIEPYVTVTVRVPHPVYHEMTAFSRLFTPRKTHQSVLLEALQQYIHSQRVERSA
jgi:hypothetical protein